MSHSEEDKGKTWSQIIKDRELRECRKCTSVISSSPEYGRKPNRIDDSICECCEA